MWDLLSFPLGGTLTAELGRAAEGNPQSSIPAGADGELLGSSSISSVLRRRAERCSVVKLRFLPAWGTVPPCPGGGCQGRGAPWAEGRAGGPGEVSSPQRISSLRLLNVRVAGERVERENRSSW